MLTFTEVREEDYAVLTDIMKRAFDDDTRMHTDASEGGPNGYADGTLLRKQNSREGYITRKVVMDGKIIGAYTVIPGEQVSELDLLFLDPDLKAKGIGSKVWEHIEGTYKTAPIWMVETPGYSLRNHYFYTKKCGFVFEREKQYAHGGKSFIFKKMAADKK